MAKRKFGKLTGRRGTAARGRRDQAKANLKQAGENIKDTLKGD